MSEGVDMNSPAANLVQDLTNIAAALDRADPRRWSEEIKSLTAWADETAARVAVVRPTRDQIANVIWRHWLAGIHNYDSVALAAPALSGDADSYALADALLARFDVRVAVSDSQETPDK